MLNRREFLQAVALGGAAIGLAGCACAAGNDAATPARNADAKATTEPVAVRTAALKGPTAMGLVRFMSEADAGNLADEDWSFQILASADEVTPLIAKSEVDGAPRPSTRWSTCCARRALTPTPTLPSSGRASTPSAWLPLPRAPAPWPCCPSPS